MGLRGQRPKPPGQAVTRHPRHDWVEVENVPNTSGPRLPPRRRNGEAWPPWVRERWNSWRALPHTRLWIAADWQFAADTAELLARAADDGGGSVALWSEIRLRERTLGTTWDARLGLRLRYVPPKTEGPANPVTALDEYRNL
ncbi:MAG: hypothetical protein JOY55_09120 [Mycobacterium sp.]|nr:hypothetical protein [Mycobacterium sp.]